MINKIWIILIILALGYGLLTKRVEEINNVILESPKICFELFITVSLMLVFWNGMLEIAKQSGLLSFIGKGIKKVIKGLFPSIPQDHIVLDYVSFNVAANMLGLGSAATPMGLKAMEELKKISKSDVASKEMITLLILNTSGLTLIPTTILAVRKSFGARINSEIIPYVVLMTFITTLLALFVNYLFQKK